MAVTANAHKWMFGDFVACYFLIGCGLGLLAGMITFTSVYIYCVVTYGLLFGLALGWLPSAILAATVCGLTILLWGPVALLLIAYFVIQFWQ